jgi:hypothetical protein
VTQSFTVSPTYTVSPTVTQTYTETQTPLPTPTPNVPTVLDRNFFNPAQGGVLRIGIKPPEDGQVAVRIYNIAGTLVRPLLQLDLDAGITFQATWDGRNASGEMVSSGVYFVSVQGAGIRSIRKVIVLK